jgi:hypothetical protein
MFLNLIKRENLICFGDEFAYNSSIDIDEIMKSVKRK